MTYIGPEENPSYIQYWNQYPDPPWIEGFKLKLYPNEQKQKDDEDTKNEDIAEELLNVKDFENIDNDNYDRDYFPFIPEYSSPIRSTFTLLKTEENLDFSKLPDQAAALARENIESLKSFSILREQICFQIDLLRPCENINPLASFSQRATVFRLSKGAIVSHYNRGIELKECGNKCVLSDAQINALSDFVATKDLI